MENTRQAKMNSFVKQVEVLNKTREQSPRFVNLTIENLTDRHDVDPRRLYTRPVTDFDQKGVSSVSPQADTQKIVQHINEVASGVEA